MNGLEERLEKILTTIAKYSSEKVTIVGVTKFQPTQSVRAAYQAGIRNFGNNYAQDGKKLMDALHDCPGISWHFIGSIQSRKVPFLLNYDLVQSLDRIKVAEALHERLKKQNKTLSVLIEVNVGGEVQKSGISIDNLNSQLAILSKLECLRIVGLMGMPPALHPAENRRPHFQKLREIYEAARATYDLKILSMGTSDDFEIALQEGANMIRLGTCLFGPRENSG